MRNRWIAFLAPLALFVSASAAPQDKTTDKSTLEWKLKKGHVHRYEMSQSSAADVQGTSMKSEMLFGFALEVTDVDDKGVASLKMTYDRVKIAMSGFQETDFDSDKDKKPEDAMGKMMAALVDQSFTMKMSKIGEIVEVKGVGELLEKAAKALGDDDNGDMMLQAMKGMYTDENMKGMLQQGFLVFSTKPVGPGDTWEGDSSFPMPMLGDMKMKRKSKLKEFKDEGREAIIEVETKLDAKKDEDPGAMFTIKDAAGKNDVVWLPERGIMQSMKGAMKMTIEAGGQEIISDIKTEMKLSPREKKKKIEK